MGSLLCKYDFAPRCKIFQIFLNAQYHPQNGFVRCTSVHGNTNKKPNFFLLIRQLSKTLIGSEGPTLSNELSAPYEVPQFPIEQIETKLLKYVTAPFQIVFLRSW
jgi:hypothetical protein